MNLQKILWTAFFFMPFYQQAILPEGTVHCHDDHAITQGTVTETKHINACIHTIQWSDRYGYGFAILSFKARF